MAKRSVKRLLAILLAILLLFISACSVLHDSSSNTFSTALAYGSFDNGDLRCQPQESANINQIEQSQIEQCLATGCSFETLPLIGHLSQQPTFEQVKSRLLVSHSWMYHRFIEVFQAMPAKLQQDMLLLFRPIAAIQIANHIRPSHYRSNTASIYLDPATLWLTREEKQDVCSSPDYRSNFGSELQFRTVSRIVKDNARAYQSYSLNDDSERNLEEIVVPFTRLLFHELAHANDFISPQILQQAASQETPAQLISQHYDQLSSTRLKEEFPLLSEEMSEYAAIRYRGREAREPFLSYDGSDIAYFFAPDGANHTYNYSTIREDIAMLFEAVLTKLYFKADWDIAFARVEKENPKCDDYVVTWGSRGRIGAPQIRERAIFAVSHILPERDLVSFINNLPEALPLTPGCGWCDNLDRLCSGAAVQSPQEQFFLKDEPMPPEDLLPPFSHLLQ